MNGPGGLEPQEGLDLPKGILSEECVSALPVHRQNPELVIHCQDGQRHGRNSEAFIVLASKRMADERLPGVIRAAKQRILDVEIAEEVLAR